MKILLIILFVNISLVSFGAAITAVQNGAWTTAATWDLNRTPADGDNVIIPSGIQVAFVNTPYPQSNPPARPTFQVQIYGTLDFSTPGNDKMYLDVGSTIQIFTGGKIQTTTSSTEIIAIYTGSADNTVWNGSPSTINGPAYATATTPGFLNGILPIKLKSFEIRKSTESTAVLQWSTSMEINSLGFVIESYNSTSKTWEAVGYVKAAQNSNVELKYSFTVHLNEGLNQFRLKETDIDNKYTYSSIVTVVSNENQEVRFVYSSASHLIRLEGSDDATIGIFDLTGRELLMLKYAGHAVPVPIVSPGVYVFHTVGKNKNQSSQKILIR